MSLVLLAFASISSAEPCAVVRREQAAFNAVIFARLEKLNRAVRRPDGSQRQPTASERKEFAEIEAEVEAFIQRFNSRLANCQNN